MTTTEKGFNIPEYSDPADVPSLVDSNISKAEELLAGIDENLKSMSEQVSAFGEAIAEMRAVVGALSDELDAVNGG